MKRRPATSSDVAKKAGVSRSAVSAVLNSAKTSARVSEEARQRILSAAAKLEYSLNPVAQSLRLQRSKTIAYVFHTSTNSLYERTTPYQLGRLIMKIAMSYGYQVIEVNSGTYSSKDPSDEILRLLLSHRADGVVLGWPNSSREVQSIIDHGFPVVQVMKPQTAEGSSTITVDASQGINAAIDHLGALGHERIAYLGSSEPHPIERARFNCFVSVLERHKIRVRREYIKLGTEYSLEEGQKTTRDLLQLPEPPSALFVVDSLALGTLRALYEARIRVPDDMSVVAYDDLLAAHLYPPLTSIVQPLQDVANYALSLIEAQASGSKGDPREPTHLVLPTHLTIRNSTEKP